MSSNFTFKGKEYKANEWLKETTGFAEMLSALILQPLPENTDLSDKEQKAIVDLVRNW